MKNRIKLLAASAFFLLLNLTAVSVTAQTALTAGDIAFSGYIGNGTTGGTDEFSFVLLKNITSGTVINFTDNGWLSTGVFRTSEESITWTANSALSAGQEIKISALTATLASGAGTPGTVTGTAFTLNANGDQVLAFQGTTAAPTFIAGIHMNVYTTANGDPVTTTAAAWDSTADTFNSSALPPGLTTGTNAIWIGVQGNINSEYDNARFTCGSANITTVAAARAALNNQANWIRTNESPGFTLPTGCSYLLVTAANVTVSGRVSNAKGRGIPDVYISLTDDQGNVRYALTNAFGFHRFDEVKSGATCILQISSKRYQFAQPTQVISVSEDLTGIDFIALPQKYGDFVIPYFHLPK